MAFQSNFSNTVLQDYDPPLPQTIPPKIERFKFSGTGSEYSVTANLIMLIPLVLVFP